MLRLALLLTILTGVAASLVACVATTPPSGLPGGVSAPDSTREALDAARARWNDAALDDYRFVFSNSCFCPEDVRGPFTITVRDGAVQEVLFDGRVVPPDPRRHPTVDDVFDRLEAAFDRDADAVQVTYDGALGYPTSAYVDYEAMATDEEERYELRDLAPLDG